MKRTRPNLSLGPVSAADAGIVVLLASCLFVVQVVVFGPVPTGPDPGNWLAMAREVLGSEAMSAAVWYPPVIRYLLALGLVTVGPVAAVFTVGVLARTLLGVGVYVFARPAGRIPATTAALVVSFAAAQFEAYAWGGYPQILATALALLSVVFTFRYLADGARIALITAGVFGLATYATHLLVGGLLVVTLAMAVPAYVLTTQSKRIVLSRALVLPVPLALVGTAYVLFGRYILAGDGFEPPINPLSTSLVEGVLHTFEEAPLLWLGIAVLAVLPWASSRRSPVETRSLIQAWSWMASSLVFFLWTGEARSLLVGQVGMVVAAAVEFAYLYRTVSPRRHARRSLGPGPRRGALIVLAVSIFSGVVVGSVAQYRGVAGFFRVVDAAELASLDALAATAVEGDIVLAASGNNGHPVGWWVEGYAGIPTYSGVDTRWLAFPEEREQATVVNRLFSGELTESETRQLVAETGADFLVVDRRGSAGPWLMSGEAMSFTVVDDSSSLVILEVD